VAARAGVPVEYRERVQGSLPHLLVIGEGFAVNDLPQVVYLVLDRLGLIALVEELVQPVEPDQKVQDDGGHVRQVVVRVGARPVLVSQPREIELAEFLEQRIGRGPGFCRVKRGTPLFVGKYPRHHPHQVEVLGALLRGHDVEKQVPDRKPVVRVVIDALPRDRKNRLQLFN